MPNHRFTLVSAVTAAMTSVILKAGALAESIVYENLVVNETPPVVNVHAVATVPWPYATPPLVLVTTKPA